MINSKHIAQIILNVILVATFITIFYFTYAKNIEEQILIKQMKYITNNLLDDFSLFVPKTQFPILKKSLQNMKEPDLTDQDKEVAENNKKVMKQTFAVLIPVVIVSLLVMLFIVYTYNLPLTDILMQGLLTLIVVGIVEFVFLKYLGGNFYSADPNYVKYKIIDEIQKNLKTNH